MVKRNSAVNQRSPNFGEMLRTSALSVELSSESQGCCECCDPEARYDAFDHGEVHRDANDGEVTILICRKCGVAWLRYFLEFEAFSRSGRWYRGLLPEAFKRLVRNPQAAVPYLASLPWYFRGGSYFGGAAAKSSGPPALSH